MLNFLGPSLLLSIKGFLEHGCVSVFYLMRLVKSKAIVLHICLVDHRAYQEPKEEEASNCVSHVRVQ